MWSNFELVSIEDETLTSAFCTNGLFRISSEEKVEKHPRVTGILQNRRLIISIDKGLVLFQDENRCNDGNFLDASYDIECLAASESGDLVICALANGTISGFHVRGVNLFTINVHPDDMNQKQTFAEIRPINGSYFVQCCMGPVYQLLIDEDKVNETMKQLDSSTMDTTLNFDDCITVNRVFEKHLREPVTSFAPMANYDLGNDTVHAVVMSASTESIYFQRTECFEKIHLRPEYCGIKQLYNLVHF